MQARTASHNFRAGALMLIILALMACQSESQQAARQSKSKAGTGEASWGNGGAAAATKKHTDSESEKGSGSEDDADSEGDKADEGDKSDAGDDEEDDEGRASKSKGQVKWEEPETSEDETSVRKRSKLIVTGVKRDDRNAVLSLRLYVDDEPEEWLRIPWPREGEVVEVDGACAKGKKPSRFEVQASDGGRSVSLPDPKLQVIKPSAERPTIGFEPSDCDNGPLCQDDNILTLECRGGEIEFKK